MIVFYAVLPDVRDAFENQGYQMFFVWIRSDRQYTMLQKLSKCEVKAWLLKFDHFTATQTLPEIKFWQIQKGPKMSFLAILDTLNFEIG